MRDFSLGSKTFIPLFGSFASLGPDRKRVGGTKLAAPPLIGQWGQLKGPKVKRSFRPGSKRELLTCVSDRLSCLASSVRSRPTTYWHLWNSSSRRYSCSAVNEVRVRLGRSRSRPLGSTISRMVPLASVGKTRRAEGGGSETHFYPGDNTGFFKFFFCFF